MLALTTRFSGVQILRGKGLFAPWKGRRFGKVMSLTAAVWAVVSIGSIGDATAEVSFKNKRIEFVVASSAGGGTDTVGRLTARFLERYLPGSPSIVVRNTGSRGHKILAANELANTAPDGLTVMQTDSSTLSPVILARKAAKYEPKDFRVVGAINRGGSVVVIRKEALPRLKDASLPGAIVAAASGQRTWQAMLIWGKEFLGWNLKWTKGYKGSRDMSLAVQRGEADVFATANAHVIEGIRKEGIIDLLVQQGIPQGNSVAPRDDFKEVPVMEHLLKKARVSDMAIRAYKSVIGPSDLDKWLALPPKTPDEIVSAYRTAFNKSVKDPEFLKAAAKISAAIKPIEGADAERLIRELRDAPVEVTNHANKLREKYGLLPK